MLFFFLHSYILRHDLLNTDLLVIMWPSLVFCVFSMYSLGEIIVRCNFTCMGVKWNYTDEHRRAAMSWESCIISAIFVKVAYAVYGKCMGIK